MLRDTVRDRDQDAQASNQTDKVRAGGPGMRNDHMKNDSMKNDYDAEYEADTLNYGSSGNGGLRWMSMLVMALVVFGFFSLVWYAYNASMSEQQQQAVAVIAPEQQEYKVKPENAGGMPIDNKDIEAYQLMRRQPSAEEEANKVERLLPGTDAPALAPLPADPVKAGEVATITSAEAGIAGHPQTEAREILPLGNTATNPQAAPSSTPAPSSTSTSGVTASPAVPATTVSPAPTPESGTLPKTTSTAAASAVAGKPVAGSPVSRKPVAGSPLAVNPVSPTPATPPATKAAASVSPAPAVSPELPVSVVKQPVHTLPAKPVARKIKSDTTAAASVKSEAIKASPAKIAAASKPKTTVTPAHAASGKAYVQLGALRSAADAEALWTKLHGANKEVLGAATHTVEPVSVAGTGTLYRLRARGFTSRAAAVTACNGLKSRGLSCLVSQ